MVLDTFIFVGDKEESPVVSRIAGNVVVLLLQIEGGGLFP